MAESLALGTRRQTGIDAHPHTFRHQAITSLTRNSGLADVELQLITGHAKRETLAIYQHVALDGDLEQKYQAAMRRKTSRRTGRPAPPLLRRTNLSWRPAWRFLSALRGL
jgi:integrase